MAVFLLWNVNRKPLDGLVQSLVRERRVDVVLLVEYAFGQSLLPALLARDGLFRVRSPARFGVFARSGLAVVPLRYRLAGRACLWRLVSSAGREGVIGLVHGLDRRNHDDSTRRVFLRRVADAAGRHERKRGHRRTLIAGDFNAHPFESAVADADGLHAIGLKAVRGRRSRAVGGGGPRRDFFYNPMWRLYGHRDHSDAGAATHHWLGPSAHELGWHMLDQVVLRPGEAERFPEEELRVVSRVGGISGISLLTADGLPDRVTASDHLPLVFHWNL